MTNLEDVAALAAELGAHAPLFWTLFETTEQCACLLDARGRHVAVNRRLCEWLGRPEGEVLGRTLADLWRRPVAERLHADHQRVLRGERRERREHLPRGREVVPVRAVGVPVRDGLGRVRGHLALFAAAPEAARPEPSRQTARLEALGRLAAGAAHDFKNLLTLVRGHLALLCDESDPAGRGAAAAALDRLLLHSVDLAQQILALVRQESPECRAVDLNAVASDVAAVLRTSAGPALRVETSLLAGLPAVLAAPGQMVQVLLNLCLNARDAMPRGGRLAIETDAGERAGRDGEGSEEGPPMPYVCLRVSDTGEGMSPEVQARMFDPFFTTKEPGRGTGLGLAVVAEIVRRHGGWVECDSAPGGGTRFEVFLPATDLAAPAFPEPEPVPDRPAARGAPEGATILLADNDGDVLRISQVVLDRGGYRVLIARNGLETVDVYRREGKRIDLVLLDRNMPGLSGEEALAELVRIDPKVRVVMVSGYTLADLSPESQMHLRGFLAKPYRPNDLLRAVEAGLAD
jgi:PAS domain S-box-containing protein